MEKMWRQLPAPGIHSHPNISQRVQMVWNETDREEEWGIGRESRLKWEHCFSKLLRFFLHSLFLFQFGHKCMFATSNTLNIIIRWRWCLDAIFIFPSFCTGAIHGLTCKKYVCILESSHGIYITHSDWWLAIKICTIITVSINAFRADEERMNEWLQKKNKIT